MTEPEGDDPHLVVGFDPVLRRRVWIHLVRPHTRPIDAVRRDLSRTGRLHWLTGRRSGSDNWDAFEAPDGHAWLAALHDGVPAWSTLKSWLLDLSGEIVAAAADKSMPTLRLDRLWVRDDGRLARLRARRQRGSFGDLTGLIVMVLIAGMLLLFLLLSVGSSVIVPGGLFTRMLAHAVVTRDGHEIGRMMSLVRVLVAWAPAIAWLLYLASSPKVQGFVPTPPNPLLGTVLTLTALGIGATVTVVRPERGPHDWLLGTRVVPR
jgi:hypothetical protein